MSDPVFSSDSGASGPARIALEVEYDGANFHGWQRQSSPQLPTVQGAMEKALSQVADYPIQLICAGRTDTGVHATAQVVHFDAAVDRGARAWLRGGNSLLPAGVRIHWARTVDDTFHARFSALSRRYRYVILESDVAPALLSRQVTHVRGHLDTGAMQRAADALPGEHDFSAFRAAGCQSRSPFRYVSHLRVFRQGCFVVIDIAANAFLQHMVRNIAGTLITVGLGQRDCDWPGQLLAGRDRRRSAATASPAGLYLVAVDYPKAFGLPEAASGPFFLDIEASGKTPPAS
ncbi:MAG: tRNA pseudouridine(38-40) synthase TruA [Pseudohongiellaceae bacterium]